MKTQVPAEPGVDAAKCFLSFIHVCRSMLIAVLVGAFACTSAVAGTINFSGRTWTTYDRVFTQQYSPGQTNDYVATDAVTGTMTGRFGSLGGDDTYMTTPV